MATRREVLRFASLATAAGCTLSIPKNLLGEDRASGEVSSAHYFHAQSSVLNGEPGSRLMQALPTQSSISISPEGGYISRSTPALQVSGIVSFKSAYIEVSGTGNSSRGWTTTSTSVIEGLNIADVVTADRIVARISTEHPAIGFVPSVSFLGTHFENLHVAGQPVHFQLDLNMLGEKPEGDVAYLSHPDFVNRVLAQRNNLSSYSNAPRISLARYGGTPAAANDDEEIEFSLVHQTSGALGKSFGHIIQLPGFGVVALAIVKLSQSDYQSGNVQATTVQLTMVEAQPINGTTTGAGTIITNGTTKP